MPTIELQNPNGGAPARVHFDTMPTDADIDEAVSNLFPKGATQTPGGTATAAPTLAAPPVPSPTMTGNVGSNIAQSAPLASAKGPLDARADDLHRQRVLASLPMPTESHLNEDVARYALDNPANAKPPRQTLGQSGPTVVTFYHRDGTPFRVVYGGGKPGDTMYGKRLPAGSPDVAKAIGAAHPSDTPSYLDVARTANRNIAGAVLNPLASVMGAESDMFHIPGGSKLLKGLAKQGVDAYGDAGPNTIQDVKSMAQGIPDFFVGDYMKAQANPSYDQNAAALAKAQSLTGPLKQVAQATGEAVGGQPAMARKTLGRILPDEAAFAMAHPLIAAVNFIPVGHGLVSLSKVGREFAMKAGAAGMATLGDKALSDAAAMAKTDPAKATALTNAGYQYHQIAAALRQGKPLGALQIKLGYEGPDLSTGQTISDATGYSGNSTRSPVAPADTAPLYTPKIGANGKPTIKTFKVNTQVPETVPATAFDKPTESAWQEPATATPTEPHHSATQPRDDTGQFVEGKPTVPVAPTAPVTPSTASSATGTANPPLIETVKPADAAPPDTVPPTTTPSTAPPSDIYGMRMADLEDAAKSIGVQLPSREAFKETQAQVKARADADYINIKEGLNLYDAKRNPNLTNEEYYVGHVALRNLTDNTIPKLLTQIEKTDPNVNPDAHAKMQARLTVALADADKLSTTLYTAASSAGRRLAFQKAVVEGPLDSAAILKKAQAAANGKLGIDAQTSIVRSVNKAKSIEKIVSDRGQANAVAALKRLENFDFAKMKADALKGCK